MSLNTNTDVRLEIQLRQSLYSSESIGDVELKIWSKTYDPLTANTVEDRLMSSIRHTTTKAWYNE